MASALRFDGRAAIVTGAGNGLGRAHALALARAGARVVVNDLGGDIHGGGGSQRAADAVVAEIRDAGGEAVASYDSVEAGDAIVATALDAFGRVDIVVNNAGILRDVSFHKMTQDDWDMVYRVHVLGSFRVTHAAWPHMRAQGYGRVIMTASASGIYGNFGQANYSMAKLGLTGFANTLAIEGRNKGIHVNTIAPLAGSRLTETVLPKELLDALKPEYVSPLVVWLCHEDCDETGGLFEVGGGFFGKLRWERAAGKLSRLGRAITPEWVRANFRAIAGFESTTHPSSGTESFAPIMQNVQAGPSRGGSELIDVDEALGWEYPEATSSYDERDLALYALGVGAAADPTDDADLRLVYELHGDGFLALPTFGVIPPMSALMKFATEGVKAPGLHYGLDRLLHGEQYLEVVRPLPRKAALTHKARIKDIWDKGKGALVTTETRSYDADGNLLVVNEFVSFVRGAGGWGGDPGPSGAVNTPPDRAPDAVTEQVINASQALLYRLTGDWNPLHADPKFARAVGFERPILHGLCTFGYAARHVLRAFAGGDPRYFKSIKVRFAASVFPGEALVTRMWKESDTRIVFECRVAGRDEAVITNAAVELFAEIPAPPRAKTQQARAASAVTSGAPSGAAPAVPTSGDIFRAIGVFLQRHRDLAAKVGKVFQFRLSDPDSVWTVDAASASSGEGETAKPDCTLALSDADFLAMCTGKADPQKLYFGGKLKITGDVMASQKLTFLSKIDPQLVIDEMNRRVQGAGASGGAAGATGASPAETAGAPGAASPTSGDVFLGIRAYVEANPALVDKIKTVFLFKLTDPASEWTLDLKTGAGRVEPGVVGTPDCTLEISDADFMALTAGKADPQQLYFGGKLKIAGDIMASQKLTFLSKIDPAWAAQKVAEAKVRARADTSVGAAAATPSAAPPAPAATREAKAPAIFAALAERLAGDPALAADIRAVVQFHVTEPSATWHVRATPGADVAVTEGPAAAPDATLTLADEDLVRLVTREISARELYQRSKLRVDGDVTVAHRLGFLSDLL